MKRSIYIVVLGLLVGGSAAAETVTISTADCRKLVAHVPSADTAYQPGVDVHGKQVVPADLGAPQIDLPTTFEIPLTVDVARRLARRSGGDTSGPDILGSRRGLEGKVALGTLTIKGDDAFWNGKQLQSQDQILMTEACKSSLLAHGIVLPEPKPAVAD